jgi:hypothetical protein
MKSTSVPPIASAQLLIVFLIGSISIVVAQTPKATPAPSPPPPFEIKDLKRTTKAKAFVDNAWKFDVPCIQATIQMTEDFSEKEIFVRAYFYNRSKQVVAKAEAPSEVGDSAGGPGYRIPDYLKAKESYKVCFAINARAAEGKDRWSRVLVVIGKGEKAVAKMIPSDDIASFPFPEKAFLIVEEKGVVK